MSAARRPVVDDVAASPDVDGRTARRDRNRSAVLDAVVELFSEDNLDPSPEDVAKRSGVSLRSVYRYYSDPEELLRAAIDRHLESVRVLLKIHAIGEGPLEQRITALVEARLRLYEAIAPAARAARMAAPRNPIIANQVELTRRSLREQFEKQFEPELSVLDKRDRRIVVAAADEISQIEAMDFLRVHRRLSTKATAEVMSFALRRMLTP